LGSEITCTTAEAESKPRGSKTKAATKKVTSGGKSIKWWGRTSNKSGDDTLNVVIAATYLMRQNAHELKPFESGGGDKWQAAADDFNKNSGIQNVCVSPTLSSLFPPNVYRVRMAAYTCPYTHVLNVFLPLNNSLIFLPLNKPLPLFHHTLNLTGEKSASKP
jgi:hypothetical protein